MGTSRLAEIPVSLPRERPAVLAIASEAAAELKVRLSAIAAEHSETLGDAGLAALISDFRRFPPGVEYDRWTPAAERAAASVGARGDARWRSELGGLLLLSLMSELADARPELRIPDSCWPFFEAGLRDLLQGLREPQPGDWSDDGFRKDVAVAQLRLLPDRGLGRAVLALNPWFVAKESSLADRARLVRYLGRGAFTRGLYLSGHAWRGFRDGRLPAGQKRSTSMLDLVLANPGIRGTFAASWMSDPALASVTPHLHVRQVAAAKRGGVRFRMAAREVDIRNALTASQSRRDLHARGGYQPAVFGHILKRADFVKAVRAELAESGG